MALLVACGLLVSHLPAAAQGVRVTITAPAAIDGANWFRAKIKFSENVERIVSEYQRLNLTGVKRISHTHR